MRVFGSLLFGRMIDGLLILGVAVVLPLALGGRWQWWAAAALGTAIALQLPPGPGAAALVLPWVAVTVFLTLEQRTLAAAYAAVAAFSLVASRLGVVAFDIREPIVQLTAVHYTYAGAAALTLAHKTGHRAAVAFTAAAPPVVALGFVTHAALPQVGGAVLMTIGVWLTASCHLRAAFRPGQRHRVLLAVSGAAVWIPMVLAVAWAAGQHWEFPVLSIPDMARTHGVGNAVGFVLCGLLGRR